jgi:GTP-binding protein HflX
MPRTEYYKPQQAPKTLLIGVFTYLNKASSIDSYFEEFLNLVKTAQIPYEDILYVKLRDIDPGFFFGKGKLAEIKETCEKHAIEQLIISERLTPQQTRNLEDYLDCTIIDRTDLILEIFEKAAISAEGKTQVLIARLQHEKTRLAGKGIHLSQQEGVVGLRGGPGEKAKERERRHIENHILQLKKELKTIQKSRDVQRKQRLGRKITSLCLIGYTNAGKSTILNALTKSDVLAEDKLFATLDTTTRALFLNGKQKGVISDTVGFIQQLPHQLIEAFKSTLSELQYADLLLHVIDISDANWQSHIKVVHQILEELGVDKEMLYVFNKSDKAQNLEALMPEIEQYQPHVIVSATSKKGLEPLINFLHEWDPEKG